MTAHELDILAAVYATGSIDGAAVRLGRSPQTVKNTPRSLYARLDVHSAIEAGSKLGWVAVPRSGTCGWLGACGRNPGHRGHHGGFR